MLVAVAIVLLAVAVVVRWLVTRAGRARRAVLAWPPTLLDVALVALVVGGVAVAAAVDGDDGTSWDAACPPAAAPEPATDGPRWPRAALPPVDDAATLRAASGIGLPQLSGGQPRCLTIGADAATGGAVVDARGWTRAAPDDLRVEAAAALRAAGYSRGVAERTRAGRVVVFGRSDDGAARAAVTMADDDVRKRTLVTVRVSVGPEFVGDCIAAARHRACRVLYRSAADVARSFDPAKKHGRVRALGDRRLVLENHLTVRITPAVSPTILEYRVLRTLDGWRRRGGLPCYLPGRVGSPRCPLSRSDPPRLPYQYRLTSDGGGYRAVVRMERGGKVVLPVFVADVTIATAKAVK